MSFFTALCRMSSPSPVPSPVRAPPLHQSAAGAKSNHYGTKGNRSYSMTSQKKKKKIGFWESCGTNPNRTAWTDENVLCGLLPQLFLGVDHSAPKPEVVFPKNWENNNCFVNSYLFSLAWTSGNTKRSFKWYDTINIRHLLQARNILPSRKFPDFPKFTRIFPRPNPKRFSLPVHWASDTSRWRACRRKTCWQKFSLLFSWRSAPCGSRWRKTLLWCQKEV